ncbi:hypothetical protein UFOVP75_1 [uncultured Caudovirales phage]|uniref:Uncharacterized protein n=1 Tax=uncultured Caudovirales phage TaxID=2100421 RepID=A0A6J5KZP1_9CAUD|nr:hypothetical protein UFOVP75_1 [uncultured Caudovirales phage]
MKESQIVHQNGEFWVANNNVGKDKQYTVYRDGVTHATADSAYAHNADGLSIAIVRCNYLASLQKR